MRDFKGMKRQRGRNRGGNAGGGHGGGGGKGGHNVNRAFDSNGPEGIKVRGHAQSVYEKYSQLARDASSSGDRVLAENYLQHAEHYFRLLRTMQPQKSAAEIANREAFAGGFDIDFDDDAEGSDEGAENAGGGEEINGHARPERGDRDQREFRGDGRRDRDRDRDRERGYGERPRGDRDRDRDQREPRRDFGGGEGRGDRLERDQREFRGDRDRSERGERDFRGERPDGRRDRGGYGERRFERANDEPAQEPAAAAEAPRPTEVDDNSTMLRAQNGDMSAAPAFLQAAPSAPAAAAEDSDGEVRRPRRRRKPRTFEGGEAEGARAEASAEEG